MNPEKRETKDQLVHSVSEEREESKVLLEITESQDLLDQPEKKEREEIWEMKDTEVMLESMERMAQKV